jgi:hypothetical protein
MLAIWNLTVGFLVSRLASGAKPTFIITQSHRLGRLCRAALGADETHIEASCCATIGIAKDQKSFSLEKRAEAIVGKKRALQQYVESESRFDVFLRAFGGLPQRKFFLPWKRRTSFAV